MADYVNLDRSIQTEEQFVPSSGSFSPPPPGLRTSSSDAISLPKRYMTAKAMVVDFLVLSRALKTLQQ